MLWAICALCCKVPAVLHRDQCSFHSLCPPVLSHRDPFNDWICIYQTEWRINSIDCLCWVFEDQTLCLSLTDLCRIGNVNFPSIISLLRNRQTIWGSEQLMGIISMMNISFFLVHNANLGVFPIIAPIIAGKTEGRSESLLKVKLWRMCVWWKSVIRLIRDKSIWRVMLQSLPQYCCENLSPWRPKNENGLALIEKKYKEKEPTPSSHSSYTSSS